MTIFIVEHLEKSLSRWCMIEYAHMSAIVGRNRLWFTNVRDIRNRRKLKRLGRVSKESVRELKIRDALILDPASEKELSPKDAKRSYLIFGGILGDYPPKARTRHELSDRMSIQTRNLGSEQMSTDTAVIVASMILGGKRLSELEFTDEPAIRINNEEEVELPFRYLKAKGKPLMSDELIRYLRRKRSF